MHLQNTEQLSTNRQSYPDLPLSKSSGTPGLCTTSCNGELLSIKHVAMLQKAKMAQHCALCIVSLFFLTYCFFVMHCYGGGCWPTVPAAVVAPTASGKV